MLQQRMADDSLRHAWRLYIGVLLGLTTACGALPTRSDPGIWEPYVALALAAGGLLLCRTFISMSEWGLWCALASLLAGVCWLALLPHDPMLYLFVGLATLICFACASWRQMATPLSEYEWTREVLWTTVTALVYWVIMASVMDDRAWDWKYTQGLMWVLLFAWYITVFGAYGVPLDSTCAQQAAAFVLWPLLSLEDALWPSPTATDFV